MERRGDGMNAAELAERVLAGMRHALRQAAEVRRYAAAAAEPGWLELWERALAGTGAEAERWRELGGAEAAARPDGAADPELARIAGNAAILTRQWASALLELSRRFGGAASLDAMARDAAGFLAELGGGGDGMAFPPGDARTARTGAGSLPPGGGAGQEQAVPIGGHTLPPLPYAYGALEPYLDAETIRIHHDILHANYVKGLNEAEKKLAEARASGNFDLVKHWERELAFNGAGHYLHTVYFFGMSPNGGGRPSGALAAQIERDFGSFEAFRTHFAQAAEKVEGSGWALLVWSPRSRRLQILQAEKHQNLTQWDDVPVLAIDMWEHSYYLKYKNERPKYIDAWFHVVNWPYAAERFDAASRLVWKPF